MITYPLNKIEYNATDAELFHCTRNSGIYAGDDFVCTVTGTDNNVTIGAGIGWIRNSKFSGKVIANKSDVVLDLGLADASFNRWDIVAIQFDKNNNATDLVVKHGTAANTPVRPEIVQTETLYELYLAAFYRRAGATTITASDVFDLRLDPTVCGLMADSVTEIDTTGINAQINALIEQLREEIAGVESSAELMLKSVYDTDNDGVVDNAAMLGGNLPEYYATKKYVDNKTGMDLLWQNASPTSNFEAQTLTFDMNKYKAFVISARYRTDVGTRTYNFIPNEINDDSTAIWANNYRFAIRYAQITSVGITFKSGYCVDSYGTPSSNMGYTIPEKIWGIK